MFRTWCERTFWNTLTKKLAWGSLILLVDVAYLYIYRREQRAVHAELAHSGVADAVVARVDSHLATSFAWFAALLATAIAWHIVHLLVVRNEVVRPIRAMSAAFEETGNGEADLSRNLPLRSRDELGTLAQNYNALAETLRQVIDEVRRKSVRIAREAVVAKLNVVATASMANHQNAIADDVFGASREATKAITAVSEATDVILRSTIANVDTATASLESMREVVAKVQSVDDKLLRFNASVVGLAERSESVRELTQVIKGIADQTNLLAFNAAVEAVRAGAHGRGFAVVAGEVRKLAERVQDATLAISENLAGVSKMVNDTLSETETIKSDTDQAVVVVQRTSREFQEMVDGFQRTKDQLNQIASAVGELNATNAQMSTSVAEVKSLSGDVTRSMQSSEKSSLTLATATGAVQELVSRFKIGQGAFDSNVERTRQFRDEVAATLTQIAATGVNIWDQNYEPIAGTRPQKYEVSYVRPFEEHIQPLLESCLGALVGGTFSLIIDAKGYAAIHNLKVSKPLTGDHQVDLVGNRTRRIWEDQTGQNAAKNTLPLLLQTYARDTGEILSELNMPIYVDGRHWGNVRVGCDSNVLMEQ